MRHLLAVDAGLRAGLAVFAETGRLVRYRSTNFGSMSRLKKSVHGVLAGVEELALVAVEGGGGGPEKPWLREAERRDVSAVAVDASRWRSKILLSRHRRSGSDAKERAETLARRVVEWSGLPAPTSLRHDAAEAILLGLWAALEVGWLEELPGALG